MKSGYLIISVMVATAYFNIEFVRFSTFLGFARSVCLKSFIINAKEMNSLLIIAIEGPDESTAPDRANIIIVQSKLNLWHRKKKLVK